MRTVSGTAARACLLIMQGVGAVALIVMMLSTVIDIIGRHFFGIPIHGTVDIVELSLVTLIFIGIPIAFVFGEHVNVSVLDSVLPPAVLRVLDVLINALTAGLLVTLLFAMYEPFVDTREFGDRTMDLGIPMTWHWSPILFGTIVSTLVVLGQLARQLTRRRKGSEHG